MTTAWNRDIAFVHIPKVAGMAITDYLQRTVPNLTGTIHRHITLNQIKELTGKSPKSFQLILGVIRNPFDRTVSQWAYWREEYARGKRSPEIEQAHNQSFAEFAQDESNLYGGTSPEGYYYHWLNYNGEILPQMKIIKMENLSDVVDAISPHQVLRGEIAQTNTSTHNEWETYYTPELKDIVAKQYKWTFENGLYKI